MIGSTCILPFPFSYNYDRLFIAGASGSGKTFLTKKILRCLDKKHYKYAVLTMGKEYSPARTFDVGYDPVKAVEQFCMYGVEHAPITLVFEDLPTLFFTPKPPKIFQMLLVRGRHLGVGFIFITHSTTRIPTIILSNTNKYVFFKILDTRQLAVFSIPELEKHLLPLKQYQFYYYDRDTGQNGIFKA